MAANPSGRADASPLGPRGSYREYADPPGKVPWLDGERVYRHASRMKKLFVLLVIAAAACSKPAEKEATVKKEEVKIPTTTAEAVTGQTPEQMGEEAAKGAAAAQAGLDEKGAAMDADR